MSRKPVTRAVTGLAVTLFAVLGLASSAMAATVLVTQNTSTWTTNDTNADGSVTWSSAFGAPPGLGSSALRLANDASPAAKSQLFTFTMAGMPLSQVDNLGYSTYQASPAGIADPSYQLQIFGNGGTSGFTTLVFEPYQNAGEGPILPATWQHWDVSGPGLFWSTRTVTCSNGTLVGSPGGPATYTLADVQAACPDATVIGIGVNIGSNNPTWTVGTDGVEFNDTTYDFEIGTKPASKDQCKNGGWQSFNEPAFKNQGDCVSYVATGGRNSGSG